MKVVNPMEKIDDFFDNYEDVPPMSRKLIVAYVVGVASAVLFFLPEIITIYTTPNQTKDTHRMHLRCVVLTMAGHHTLFPHRHRPEAPFAGC